MKQYEVSVSGSTNDFSTELKTALVNKISEVSTMAQSEMLARFVGGTVIESCSKKNEECECEDPENCECEEMEESVDFNIVAEVYRNVRRSDDKYTQIQYIKKELTKYNLTAKKVNDILDVLGDEEYFNYN
jgi:hypothetical protein